VFFASRRDQPVGDLAPPLASQGQQPLDMQGAAVVCHGGFDKRERFEGVDQLIPLVHITRGKPDLDADADAGATDLAGFSERPHHIRDLQVPSLLTGVASR
jgi:hypothetical protein